MLEQIPLSQLALLLSDIEIILNHFAAHDKTAVERLTEIDHQLEELQQTDDTLTHLLQTELDNLSATPRPETTEKADTTRPLFAVASEGVTFWQALHDDLLIYFSWQIDRQEAEQRLPQLETQLVGSKRFLEEITSYVVA